MINVASYTASKHAVVGLTKALATEWAAGGVNVNAVAPGYVATANTALAHQLQMDAATLIDALNARVGATTVKRLRFIPM